jgi:hypothetical protein
LITRSHVTHPCMSAKSNKPNYLFLSLENVLKWPQIKCILKMCSTRRGPRDHPSVNSRPLGRAEMSGGKEPGGPTYVTDGLTSGATGPSPEHRGAPPKGGVRCGVGGSYPCGNVGAVANEKQLASHVRMLNFLFGTSQEAPSKVQEANKKQGSIQELLPGTVNGPCWCCSGP